MAKKLTVEVDAETSKAKRKLRELGENSSGSVGSSADTEKAARSLKNLGNEAEKAKTNLGGVAKAFAGMATGLALSYAARRLEQGSAARNAVEYGGSVISGASAGAMAGMAAGPWGAAIGGVAGGVIGGAKTYLDKSSEKEDAIKEFRESEALYANTKEWADKLRNLSKSMDKAEVDEISKNLRETIEHWKKLTEERLENGEYDKAKSSRRALDEARSRLGQLDTLSELIEKKSGVSMQADWGATNALQKLGGFAAGSTANNNYSMQQYKVSQDQLAELKKIRELSEKESDMGVRFS